VWDEAEAMLHVALERPLVFHESADDDWRDRLIATWLHGTLTFRGIRYSCIGGYSRAGDAQARALFEDLMVAAWMVRDRRAIVPIYQAHFRHTQLRYKHLRKKHGITGDGDPKIPAFTRGQIDALEKRFGKIEGRGQRPWYGDSLWPLIDDHLAGITNADEKRGFDQFADMVYTGFHQRAHNTPAGLNALYFEADKKGILEDPQRLAEYAEPSHHLTIGTLQNATWIYARLVQVAFVEFGWITDQEELVRLVDDAILRIRAAREAADPRGTT
jgi:hypothetical protein